MQHVQVTAIFHKVLGKEEFCIGDGWMDSAQIFGIAYSMGAKMGSSHPGTIL